MRVVESGCASFSFDNDGRPVINVLSRDQKEEIQISLDDLDVAMLAQKSTAYLANRLRERQK